MVGTRMAPARVVMDPETHFGGADADADKDSGMDSERTLCISIPIC
jgi:hypothetical protein